MKNLSGLAAAWMLCGLAAFVSLSAQESIAADYGFYTPQLNCDAPAYDGCEKECEDFNDAEAAYQECLRHPRSRSKRSCEPLRREADRASLKLDRCTGVAYDFFTDLIEFVLRN